MRSIILLLLFSASSLAQMHQNQPLPEIQEETVKIIDEDITGWSKSLDGQWISSEMTIPVRVVSKDAEAYETNESALGMDNISQLLLYKTKYGEEELCTLIKISKSGYYKYSATQQKWQETEDAYYYIFDTKEINSLKDISDKTSLTKIPLRDYGLLRDIRSKKIIETLEQHIIIRPQTERFLVATLKTDSENPDKIYFQLSSQHRVFTDIEGVLHDFKIQGNSVYRSPFLLDYLHYEYDKEAFNNFFTVE